MNEGDQTNGDVSSQDEQGRTEGIIGRSRQKAMDIVQAKAPTAAAAAKTVGTKVLEHLPRGEVQHATGTVTINRPIEEVYRFWRQLERLPKVMPHLERIDVIDERRSHWVAKGPGGLPVEWDAEIHEDVENEMISWRAQATGDIPHVGLVSFRQAPADWGTEVHVKIHYRMPTGRAGNVVAAAVGESPQQQIAGDLRRLKQLLECGEVLRVDEQPSGRGPIAKATTKVLTTMMRKAVK